MKDYIWFIILLILIAASVALVFLILFGENPKISGSNKSLIKKRKKSEPNEAELIAKLRNVFSDEEIIRIIKIWEDVEIKSNKK